MERLLVVMLVERFVMERFMMERLRYERLLPERMHELRHMSPVPPAARAAVRVAPIVIIPVAPRAPLHRTALARKHKITPVDMVCPRG